MQKTPKKPVLPDSASRLSQDAHGSGGENHPRPTRICVVGAGSSGLVTLKTLIEKNLPATCFESGHHVGGLWVQANSNGLPGAYDSLHINTSTKEMEFSDFPMRSDIGDFPHHRHIAEYFENYANHFELREHIQFQTRVEHCEPMAVDAEGMSPGYHVTLLDTRTGNTRTENFAAIIVANGHHFSPALPNPNPAQGFSGLVTHSSEYQRPSHPHDFRSKHVLVVGMGNSAMDIACELSHNGSANSVTVSARRGAWVLPKYLRGKPIDQGTVIPTWLPASLRRRVVTRAFEWLFGKMSDFGLPEPDHLIGEAHPTVSSDFPPLVAAGKISMRPAIAKAQGRLIQFTDNSYQEFDAIIFCTGYHIEFSFFSTAHINAPDNELPLYHRAFHPEHRRVFFVGLLQTIGAVMPTAELQARAIAAHLSGDFNLPPREQMEAVITAQVRAMKKRFVASKRHTMQVDPPAFRRLLQKDLILGRKRALQGTGIAFPDLRNLHINSR